MATFSELDKLDEIAKGLDAILRDPESDDELKCEALKSKLEIPGLRLRILGRYSVRL